MLAHNCRIARQRPVLTLSRERARKMHVELAKLGLSNERRYALASEITGRDIQSLTALTEREARAVWNAARREVWAASRPQQTSVTCSDDEALEILGAVA